MRGDHDANGGCPNEQRPTPACAGITTARACSPRSNYGLPPRARGSQPARSTRAVVDTAYPRVRGDHVRLALAVVISEGPTPACAGITLAAYPGSPREWPTPACAGITSLPTELRRAAGLPPRARGSPLACLWRANVMRAYPRVRGDHFRNGRFREHAGLPPRARGSPSSTSAACGHDAAYPRVRGDHWVPARAPRGRGGPTPACAGITVEPHDEGPAARGLPPRARGSRVDSDASAVRHGLPPRARGSPRRLTSGVEPGPTPACAGITVSPARSVMRAVGPPPRARGSLLHIRQTLTAGPTPACAGITTEVATGVSTRGLPPRARGSPRGRAVGHAGGGLPPRARGSRAHPREVPRRRAYPRVRGDHFYPGRRRKTAGLPPRARGSRVSGQMPHERRAYPRVRGDHSGVRCDGRGIGLPPRARGSPSRSLVGASAAPAYPRVRGDHCAKARWLKNA